MLQNAWLLLLQQQQQQQRHLQACCRRIRWYTASRSPRCPGQTDPTSTSASPRQDEDDDPSFSSEQRLREALCEASLPFVHQLGWSQAALLAGARQLQLSPAVVGVLPRQAASLAEHLVARHNQQLAQELRRMAPRLAQMGTARARLRAALQLRLQMLAPYASTWPQALGLLAQPSNGLHALALLAAMVDDVWHAAGDADADLGWYAKRASLAAVYSSAELFMLTDFSPHYQDTWSYLDRRLGDIEALGRLGDVEALGAAGRDVAGAARGALEALAQLAASRLQQASTPLHPPGRYV